MNEVGKYIPYGSIVLGAGVGYGLYRIYPKLGIWGTLIAVTAGGVGGYFISKAIVKKIESKDMKEPKFSNAIDLDNTPMMPCKKFTCPKGFSYTEDKGCVNMDESLNYIDCPPNHFWCPRRRVCCINPNNK